MFNWLTNSQQPGMLSNAQILGGEVGEAPEETCQGVESSSLS